MIVCDFCSSPDVVWSYPAHDFGLATANATTGEVIPEVPIIASGGNWAACACCGKLIEANDRGALMERAITTLGFPPIPELQIGMREIHDAFFTCRTGPAVPIEPKGAA